MKVMPRLQTESWRRLPRLELAGEDVDAAIGLQWLADPTGFTQAQPSRDASPTAAGGDTAARLAQVYEDFDRSTLQDQASRCMDCGIPFCH